MLAECGLHCSNVQRSITTLTTLRTSRKYIEEEDYSSSGRLFCCKGGFKEILLSLLARRLRIGNCFTVHCQYITLRFLGDNPPASYVFLPSLLILTIAIFLLKTGWRHPAGILCLHQRWNRCILAAPCSGWFVNIKMSVSTFYGLVSNQPLPQHLILISIIWQSGILRTCPQAVVTKAIMTTASTCRSLWIVPKPYLGVTSIWRTWFGNYLDLIIPKLDLLDQVGNYELMVWWNGFFERAKQAWIHHPSSSIVISYSYISVETCYWREKFSLNIIQEQRRTWNIKITRKGWIWDDCASIKYYFHRMLLKAKMNIHSQHSHEESALNGGYGDLDLHAG